MFAIKSMILKNLEIVDNNQVEVVQRIKLIDAICWSKMFNDWYTNQLIDFDFYRKMNLIANKFKAGEKNPIYLQILNAQYRHINKCLEYSKDFRPEYLSDSGETTDLTYVLGTVATGVEEGY